MRKIDGMISEARKAAVAIRNFQGIVRIVSHYDADGIAAASIIALALVREGKQFRLSIIKQLSEGRIKELSNEGNRLTIFTDLGSGHLKSIQEHLIFPGAKVLVLDHHQVKGEILAENSENIIHVNPMLFGINENLSGAGVTYFLAKELDPENIELGYLGVVGAVGDSQMGSIEERWGLSGPNKEILKDAKKSQKLSVSNGLRIWGKYSRPLHKALEYSTDPCIPGISGSESASVQFLNELGIPLKSGSEWRTLSDLSEDEKRVLASGIIKERIRGDRKNAHEIFGDVYEIPDHPPEFRSAEEFATVLNACGKLGKPYVGLSMCMRNPQSFDDARNLLSDYRKDIGKAISWMNRNKDAIKKTERCTYMLAGDRVSEHIISNIASIFNKSGLVPEDRPVFAFADAEEGKVKVSARAHDILVENGMNMERLVSIAASRFGGEGGGHRGAAGATIPKEAQDMFISYIEEMLGRTNDGLFQLDKTVPLTIQSNLNINTPEEQTLVDFQKEVRTAERSCEATSTEVLTSIANGDENGTAETERGQSSAGSEREERGSTSSQRGKESEKMEGKGLVRYFGPKDVQ
ncbi:MAG: DHH family phosphoesterase [Candidatus Aenigmarchaeota archaeon]|nr:DHH family phosphoesterase [Candidatus Aenigmarchaeota archaeon]